MPWFILTDPKAKGAARCCVPPWLSPLSPVGRCAWKTSVPGARSPASWLSISRLLRPPAMISGAVVEGAAPGARTLFFKPRGLFPGNYRFDIGTAGSTSLVFQTILVPLSFAEAPSNVMITGGTHVSWSPSFHFLQRHFRPFLKSIGFNFDLVLAGAGYYPQGGGCVKATIHPARKYRSPGIGWGAGNCSGSVVCPAPPTFPGILFKDRHPGFATGWRQRDMKRLIWKRAR